MSQRRVSVIGPAYLDRVLRVDQPLVDHASEPPLDQSVEGTWKFGPNDALELADPTDYALSIKLPTDWPGPNGLIDLSQPIRAGVTGHRSVNATAWHDDLGGMGAGYAAALKGKLLSALGSESDLMSQSVSRRLADLGIDHDPIRVPDHCTDWTLLITSGPYGDKLPIGFRGCHAALEPEALEMRAAGTCDLRVVASLPNRIAAHVLAAPGATCRFFAPAMRNVLDRECPVSRFTHSIDILSCNRREWEALEDREEVAWQLSILIVTDGPVGSIVRYTNSTGEAQCLRVSAFPRGKPPRDTNRAGESYAATLLSTLLDNGWQAASGIVDDALIQMAAERASAAAALQLDRERFGFPSDAEIESAIQAGCVG